MKDKQLEPIETPMGEYKCLHQTPGMCSCGNSSPYKEDCYYHSEFHDMGATIHCCSLNKGIGNCPCENCLQYLSKEAARSIINLWSEGFLITAPLWIDTNDRLPEQTNKRRSVVDYREWTESDPVLCVVGGKVTVGKCIQGFGWGLLSETRSFPTSEVTHWMPFPEPPEENIE